MGLRRDGFPGGWPRPGSRALATAIAATLSFSAGRAAELPQPCTAGACGANGPLTWVTSGVATGTVVGNSFRINQQTQNATLNWRTFNIGADGKVEFQQPNSSAVALNRIFEQDPSRILGALDANGQVYLINTNGIVFGAGARVNVGGLVASTLDVTPEALANGIAQAINATPRAAAFRGTVDATGKPLNGNARIEQGATIEADGGQVMVFAPDVRNEGVIRTPDGQTVLAAGTAVYLAASTDPNLRGLLVQVDGGGTVVNGTAGNRTIADPAKLVGQIVAERGNVTLAGLAVNQLGRVSATTSVRANGTIRLQAGDGVEVVTVPGGLNLLARRGGDLVVGERALVDVQLDADDPATQVDVNAQPRSQILMQGRSVALLEHSRTAATSGLVSLSAQADPRRTPDTFAAQPDDSRVYVAGGAVIDVSGAQVELPVERNVVRVELRGTQLADSPVQRDGVLRGQTVYVDVRRSGTREDGTSWQGTPLADVSGDIAVVPRSVGERNLAGGSIEMVSQGALLLDRSARLDVSGGSIQYLDGYLDTTKLVSNGRVVDIGAADPNLVYQGIVTDYSITSGRWGVTRTFPGFARDPRGAFERGYLEGKDAGSLSLLAPAIALDSSIVATTQRGLYQRRPSASIPDGSLYRPFDQVPLGARLTVGNASSTVAPPNRVVRDLVFAPGFVLTELANADGSPFDPRRDPLPGELELLRLRPELLGPDRFARLTVRANGSVELPADVALELPDDGALSIAAGRVSIAGDVTARSGSISLAAENTLTTEIGDIELAVLEGASLSAAGRWINDSATLNAPGAALDPLYQDAGSITLSANQGSLEFAAGALIDVSGGAWLDGSGRLRAGSGGSVTISNTPATELLVPSPFVVAGTIRGHSVDRAGQLSMTTGSICIGDVDCTSDEVDSLVVRPGLLESSGFGGYALNSNRLGVELTDGTTITLRQLNLLLPDDLASRPSGAGVRDFAALGVRDALERRPVNLSLSAGINAGSNPYTNANFDDAPGLRIGTGSIIDGDVGARLALAGNTWIEIDGRLSAPAGDISVDLGSTLRVQEFLDGQAIWLGSNAQLATVGAARVVTNDRGLRSGEVLDGGSVAIVASRGYLVTLPGSSIDASGTSAELDLPPRAVPGAAPQPERVESSAGDVELRAAEGLLLNGRLLAAPGGTDTSAGGRLTVSLDPGSRADPGSPQSLFPLVARTVTLVDQPRASVVPVRAPIPRAQNGSAVLDSVTFANGQFDSLVVQARDLYGRFTGPSQLAALGRIEVDGAAEFRLPVSIELDAARLDARNGDLRVLAPYVTLANDSVETQVRAALLPAGIGTIGVEAGLIDVRGNVGVEGARELQLQASGDLRLNGVQLRFARALTGSLVSAGDIRIAADQVYPSTLSRFELAAIGNPEGRVVIDGQGTPGAALSAGASLLVNAPVIEQRGVLRVPFGGLTLRGGDVQLADGSTTSTSGDGQVVPFGETQGGFDWVYRLGDNQTLVIGSAGFELPQQRQLIEAPRIDLADGATIDLAGGGDLLAYEWQPGVGGSRDLLSPAERPHQFAIVPGLALASAPVDPAWNAGSSLAPGAAVNLAAAPGLEAGTYTLLPARYALLPGAFLVTAVDGYQDIRSGETFALADGSTVVAGYRTIAGTDRRDARSGGFALRPGSAIQAEASYALSSANEFIPERAADAGTAVPRLPRDAGILQLVASQSLSLAARLLAEPDKDGRGAAADIASAQLRIVSAAGQAAAGEVLLLADELERFGAESLLIGGRRSQDAAGLRIQTVASSVTVDGDVTLQTPELVLAASDRVSIGAGARLVASGAVSGGDERYVVSGDGALVRVSAGPQVEVLRENSAGQRGTATIGKDAVLRAAGGSVAIDASRDSSSAGRIEVPDGSLSLGSSRISLGDVVGEPGGVVLDDEALAALGAAELVLSSRSSIDFYGSVALSADRLVFNAGGLRARTDDTVANVGAVDSVELVNRAGVVLAAPVAGSGELGIESPVIRLGAGNFSFDGFASTRMQAGNALVSTDVGTSIVAGDLEVSAGRITSAAGVDRRMSVTGNVILGSVAAPLDAPPLEDANDTRLGGSLRIEAADITQRGLLEFPAGRVELLAAGGSVRIESGAEIRSAGYVLEFDGVDVSAPGGEVRLEATRGDVIIAEGATVDVSSPGAGGRAGRLVVVAAQGKAALRGDLLGVADQSGRGGTLEVDGATIENFGALNQALNAGGFDRERSFRLRGPGDLAIAAGQTAVAHRFAATADAGRIDVAGTIDARGPDGGHIELNARDAVRIAGALLANATAADGDGGRVLLASSADVGAQLALAAASLVDVSAGSSADANPRPGAIELRLARTSLVDAGGQLRPGSVTLAGQLRGTPQARLEAVARYLLADGRIGDEDVAASVFNPLYADTADFMAQAGALEAALGGAARIVPGLEIAAAGDLVLEAGWDLSQWRFNDRAGVLALRASGDLRIERSLSDGFAGLDAFVLPDQATESWSYRLVAGADRASADVLAVLAGSGLPAGKGSLAIAPGDFISTDIFQPSDFRMIRTGTGDIRIRTARDLELGNQASVIYTAGVAGPGIRLDDEFAGLGNLPYPTGGGDIDIRAGGDIRGAISTQLFTDWLWRAGRSASEATAWTASFQRFEQGIAAIDGSVRIRADGDIENLSVNLPAIGIQVGGLGAGQNEVEFAGGGDLSLEAGGSIHGGTYLVGGGSAQVVAGDSLTTATRRQTEQLRELDPIFGLMGDSALELIARQHLGIESVLNPTLVPKGVTQGQFPVPTFFASYGPDSRVSATAVAGEVRLRSDEGVVARAFASLPDFAAEELVSLRVWAPTLRASAMSSDIELLGLIGLFPAPKGNLELFANRDILGESPNGVQLNLSDADVDFLPTIERPQDTLGTLFEVFGNAVSGSRNLHAAVPVHDDRNQPDGVPDLAPARVVARLGSIRIGTNQSDDSSGFFISKAGRFVAGSGIVDLRAVTQHLRPTDVTAVVSAGDISYGLRRNSSGIILGSSREIVVDGPGRLEIRAGGDINLQTSTGIVTRGNVVVPGLADGGASISIMAGLAGQAPDYAAFLEKYVVDGEDYDERFVAYVEQVTGRAGLDEAAALAAFGELSTSLQAAFLEPLFLVELRESGRLAAQSPNADYGAAFAALETFFPGSNPDPEADPPQSNAYDGDLLLFFSRIYTLDGGSISTFVPGGEINVGLSTPPAAFGVSKAASQLGIVVQGAGSVGAVAYADFSVNESRVFAADGGDILVWSTRGDIDAGRGAKTAISAPPPTITFDANGNPQVVFPAALAGSGIQTLASSEGLEPGDVDLYAPRGIVNAGDAGIVAGNLTIGATAVLGADNIQVGGVTVGVPVDTGGLSASLTGVSTVGSAASDAASDAAAEGAREREESASGESLGESALSWLEVFVIGLGEEQCDQRDLECLKRQKKGAP